MTTNTIHTMSSINEVIDCFRGAPIDQPTFVNFHNVGLILTVRFTHFEISEDLGSDEQYGVQSYVLRAEFSSATCGDWVAYRRDDSAPELMVEIGRVLHTANFAPALAMVLATLGAIA